MNKLYLYSVQVCVKVGHILESVCVRACARVRAYIIEWR